MARNIKLGPNTITNVNTITVDDADTPNTEDTFYSDDLFENVTVEPTRNSQVISATSPNVALDTVNIAGVTTVAITASNLKHGVNAKVGSTMDDDSILNVTGTFTSRSTSTAPNGAAYPGQILSGYSAWVDGAEVQGTMTPGITPTGKKVINTLQEVDVSAFATAQVDTEEFIGSDTTGQTISAGQHLPVTLNAADYDYSDRVIVSEIENLVASKIQAGAQIAGVTGTFTNVTSPDVAATASDIASGKTAFVNGAKLTGNMDVGADTTGQTIQAVASLPLTIYATDHDYSSSVKISAIDNLTAGNIRMNSTIVGVPGTFSSGSTVSSGQTAATAAQLRSGYSAFINGAELRGSMANGSATTPATTVTANPSVSGAISGSNYVVTATVSKTQSVTPTVSAGYVSSGTAGTITVSGSNILNIPIYDGTVV